jgi:hypothetical protein
MERVSGSNECLQTSHVVIGSKLSDCSFCSRKIVADSAAYSRKCTAVICFLLGKLMTAETESTEKLGIIICCFHLTKTPFLF